MKCWILNNMKKSELLKLVKHITESVISEFMNIDPATDANPDNKMKSALDVNNPTIPTGEQPSMADQAKQKHDLEKQRRDTLKQKEAELVSKKKETDFNKKKLDQQKRFEIPTLTKDIQQLKK